MQTKASKTNFYFKVAENVWGMKDIFVNLYMVKSSTTDNWFLVDGGLKTSWPKIKRMAASLFGDKKPQAVILTHGHFDHIGALNKITEEWKVPVYAHYLELPYLTGKSSYPPPDPTVGGGLMAYMSALYPTSPIDLGTHVSALPDDGTIPGFDEWRFLNTPGHTFGHISLFRDDDKTLIAGDAFITTKGESAMNALFLQTQKISAPPAYFTPDWEAAYSSIRKLLLLEPEVAATGHGKPMYGIEMLRQLLYLYENFFEEFVPQHGRYIDDPAVGDAGGILYVPSAERKPYTALIVVGATTIVTILTITVLMKKKKRRLFNF